MRQVLRHAGIVFAFVALSLPGCGDGGSQPETSGSGGSPAGATPVVGKPVTRTSQLDGTWFRRGDLSADQLVGIEFTPNGETITFVSAGAYGIREATFPFTLLDGGRIRVTHPQYPTESQVAVIKVDGSAFSLEPETQSRQIGMIAASFDKLSGKTVRQRLEEHIAEVHAEREAMKQDIALFIRQPNLVLLPEGLNAARIALDTPAADGQIAYQRVGETVLARQAQLEVDLADDGSPIAALQLGPVVGPPGSPDITHEILRFTPRRGNDGKLTLASNAATFRNDSALHAALKRDYDTLLQARRKIIDAFHDQVGHFLFLQAETTTPNVAPEQLAFLRIDGDDAYRVAILRANALLMPGSFIGAAVVQLANDEARLRTNTHQVLPDPHGPAGAFIVSTRNGSQRYTTLHRLTREELDAKRARCAALLQGMATQPLNLVGVYQSSERGYVRPARFALTSPDGKGLAGTFHSDAVAIEIPVNGTIEESTLGLVFRIAVARPSPHIIPGGNFTEAGTFTLHLQLNGNTPVLTGRTQPGDNANRITLTAPSAESLTALRQAFFNHLQTGGRFSWDRTGSTGGSDEVLSLTLAPDGTGGVTGSVGFRRDQTAPAVGRLSEVDGLLVLDLTVQPTPDAAVRHVGAGPMRLYIIPFENTFQLSGHSTWNGATRTRYISYAPTSP